jgi:tyrosine-protein kinase Etk/Wzc
MDQKDQIDQIDQTDEINLLDYWRIIWKRRLLILLLFLISVVAAAIISLHMTPIFQAKATLMPVESSQSRFSGALGALQNIPFVGGAVGGALGKTATDKIVTILNSRTVAEDVIKKMDLIKILFKKNRDQENGKWKTDKPPTMQDTLRVLRGIVKVADDRKGLISITVEYEDPKLAADIANNYTTALHQFLSENTISLVKRSRLSLEKQLAVTKVDLQRTEEDLKNYQMKKKVVAMDAQAEGAIKTLADLKAQIMAREVQLGVFKEFATKANPDVQRIEDEIRELQKQLKRLEIQDTQNPKENESIGAFITLSEAPSIGLQYARLKRDALIQQKIFELLTQQYELAKIEEAKDDITFQIIDPAIPPEKRIKPKRTQNVLLAGVVSLFLGIFLVFFLEYLAKQKSPSQPLPPS